MKSRMRLSLGLLGRSVTSAATISSSWVPRSHAFRQSTSFKNQHMKPIYQTNSGLLCGLLLLLASGISLQQASAVPTSVVSTEEGNSPLSLSSSSSIAPRQPASPPRLQLVGARWKKVLAGERFTVGVRTDGTVAAWGDNSLGQTNVPLDLYGAQDIAVGRAHTLCLLTDGTIRAFGWNKDGQTNVPKALRTPATVSFMGAGYSHSVVVLYNGTVVSWGSNSAGQRNAPKGGIGGGGDARDFKVGWFHNIAYLRNNTLLCWGSNIYKQCQIPKFAQPPLADAVIRMTAGAYFSLVQLGGSNGSFFAWGKGFDGGVLFPAPRPGYALSLIELSAGSNHFLLHAQGPDGVFAFGNKPECLGNCRSQTHSNLTTLQ